MPDEEITSMEELEALLDQHDYDMPEVGDIRKGIIVSVSNQGVIVDLGLKRDGLVQSSDLSKLSAEEREELQVDEDVFVYIVQTDQPDSLIISVHLAKLNQDWIDAENLLESGDVIEGEIAGYNKGGAIVLFGRIRGFIPLSHLVEFNPGMSDRKRQQKLAKLRGTKLPLKVIEVDRRRKRLVFSQREAQREWEEVRRRELLEELTEGETRSGRVSGLRDFGIFVDLGGADGLVHISELAWHRVDHPREVIKVGDEIDVYVMRVDKENERISLSRKRLLANPWDTVEERYEINQLVEGEITRLVDYGAFAEIEPGVEGLLHLSQLSRSSVESPGEVVQVGEKHLLRVVSVDSRRQRIGLSLKAVTASEQIDWMAQRDFEESVSESAADDNDNISSEDETEEEME
ncbi:MAG: S1 RNA-binding domain-containing protein [Chloroflexota bacterium]